MDTENTDLDDISRQRLPIYVEAVRAETAATKRLLTQTVIKTLQITLTDK